MIPRSGDQKHSKDTKHLEITLDFELILNSTLYTQALNVSTKKNVINYPHGPETFFQELDSECLQLPFFVHETLSFIQNY